MMLGFSGVGGATILGIVFAPFLGPLFAWLTYLWAGRWQQEEEGAAVGARRVNAAFKASIANIACACAVLLFGAGPAFSVRNPGADAGMGLLQVFVSASPAVLWASILSLLALRLRLSEIRKELGGTRVKDGAPPVATVLLYELAVWLTPIVITSAGMR